MRDIPSPSVNISLRRFTVDDAAAVAKLVGDQAVSKWTSNIPYPYSERDAVDWIQHTASDNSRKPFAVELNGQLVACVSYWPHDADGLEVGYWVGKEYWARGIGTKALALLLRSEHIPVGTDIHAKVMAANIGSQRVLEKCGFSFVESGLIVKGDREIEAKFYVRRAAR